MTLPNNPHIIVLDIRNRLYDVAKTLRSLADEIAGFACYSDPMKIRTISVDVAKIGWNSLFISTMMDDIQPKSIRWSEVPSDRRLQQLANHLDSLHAGAKYLERSIMQLKERMKFLPSEQADDFSKVLSDLAERLEKVGNECK